MTIEESCRDGTHATSRLAAEALRHARAASVLDVGTGDGFLARVAREAGVPRVVGLDREPLSFPGAIVVDLFDADPGRFEIVVANLPDDVLFRALPRLASWTERALIVTGVRLYRAGALVVALRRAGLSPARPRALDGWVCVTAFVDPDGWRDDA